MAAGSPAANGAMGKALDCWRDDLDLSVEDLAALTPYDAEDLAVTLSGNVPAPDGHGPAICRALADFMEAQTVMAASA